MATQIKAATRLKATEVVAAEMSDYDRFIKELTARLGEPTAARDQSEFARYTYWFKQKGEGYHIGASYINGNLGLIFGLKEPGWTKGSKMQYEVYVSKCLQLQQLQQKFSNASAKVLKELQADGSLEAKQAFSMLVKLRQAL